MSVYLVTARDSPLVCLRQVLVLIDRLKVVLIVEVSAAPQWSSSWNGVNQAILDT